MGGQLLVAPSTQEYHWLHYLPLSSLGLFERALSSMAEGLLTSVGSNHVDFIFKGNFACRSACPRNDKEIGQNFMYGRNCKSFVLSLVLVTVDGVLIGE
jgi:hypothetical protein